MSPFDEQHLVTELANLGIRHRVAFAASVCDRLLPNYEAFALMEHINPAGQFLPLLEEVWAYLGGANLPLDRINALIQYCKSALPDTETYSSLFANPAFNTVCALIYTLESCVDGSPHRIGLTARLACDTVDLYVQRVDHPNPSRTYPQEQLAGLHRMSHDAMIDWLRRQEQEFDNWVLSHPLMIAELTKQQQDLLALAAQPSLTSMFLTTLRESAHYCGLQPKKRGIVCYTDN